MLNAKYRKTHRKIVALCCYEYTIVDHVRMRKIQVLGTLNAARGDDMPNTAGNQTWNDEFGRHRDDVSLGRPGTSTSRVGHHNDSANITKARK